MKPVIFSLFAVTFLFNQVFAQESGCSARDCHLGIEEIRGKDTLMMRQIIEDGLKAGDPEGCVVCHKGDPRAEDKDAAHKGMYSDPGSPWINKNTCGLCHANLTDAQFNSLMMTEAGKIQGASWSFGAMMGYDHGWGNYDAENPTNPDARRGTERYKKYMASLKEKAPNVYPDRMKGIPEAPVDMEALKKKPEQSAFTYMRAECQRCHLAVRGRTKRGDYRGMGCSACHIPYSNEGFYEGGDKTVPADVPGRLLVHRIQATREAEVKIHDKTYTGIPVETCTTCHDRGKRIGVSYQGLMEIAYKSPFVEGGKGQAGLHTKHYVAMQMDIHYQGGMMCQDCHTSIDVHGDGFLAGTNLAQVQIECADCHGTPQAYPWELPLGFGDEFQENQEWGEPRGVAKGFKKPVRQGRVYDAGDGHLLTARGNPFPEVVRQGNMVIVHTAGGNDLELKPLKLLAREQALTKAPKIAMEQVGLHLEKMECYACHAPWAPQCYGCHVKIDYSENKKSFDWVAAGRVHQNPLHASDRGENYDCTMPGKVHEERSYLRFEDPPLGVNGEGRITPIIPGCQPSITVIGADGETLLLNHIFRTQPGAEGSGDEGQLCMDMSPVNPHTTNRARSCESCHASEKALGYGISGGRLFRPMDKPIVIDLMTADGMVLPKSTRNQIEPINGLADDWSRFVTEEGDQVQTVGHHFPLSRPLNREERAHMEREGVCLSCHKEIPEESLAVGLLHHAAKFVHMLPKTNEQHESLIHKMLMLTAWGQVGGGTIFGLLVLVFFIRWRRRRKLKNS